MTKYAVYACADVGGPEDGPIIKDYLIAYYDTPAEAENAAAQLQAESRDDFYYVRDEEISDAEYEAYLEEQKAFDSQLF